MKIRPSDASGSMRKTKELPVQVKGSLKFLIMYVV
jgi:hypothetical protein